MPNVLKYFTVIVFWNDIVKKNFLITQLLIKQDSKTFSPVSSKYLQYFEFILRQFFSVYIITLITATHILTVSILFLTLSWYQRYTISRIMQNMLS